MIHLSRLLNSMTYLFANNSYLLITDTFSPDIFNAGLNTTLQQISLKGHSGAYLCTKNCLELFIPSHCVCPWDRMQVLCTSPPPKRFFFSQIQFQPSIGQSFPPPFLLPSTATSCCQSRRWRERTVCNVCHSHVHKVNKTRNHLDK